MSFCIETSSHCLNVGGLIVKKMCKVLDVFYFCIYENSTVILPVYLQNEAPEGSLSLKRHAKSGSI